MNQCQVYLKNARYYFESVKRKYKHLSMSDSFLVPAELRSIFAAYQETSPTLEQACTLMNALFKARENNTVKGLMKNLLTSPLGRFMEDSRDDALNLDLLKPVLQHENLESIVSACKEIQKQRRWARHFGRSSNKQNEDEVFYTQVLAPPDPHGLIRCFMRLSGRNKNLIPQLISHNNLTSLADAWTI